MMEKIEGVKAAPKGIFKIELTDVNTGEKDTVEQHNFISQGTLNNFFKAKIADVFGKNRAMGSREPGSVFLDPFARLMLTDATHPEDPLKEWLIKGNTVGYALSDIVYSGADTLRGGLNIAESISSNDLVKLVFDFPTHAANGTFNSIYFCPKQYGFTTVSNVNQISALSSIKSVAYKDGLYYVLKGNSDLFVYDLTWKLVTQHSSSSYSAFYDMTIVGEYMYFSSITRGQGVFKAPISDPTVLENVYTLAGATIAGIAYCDVTNSFYLLDTYNSVCTLYNLSVTFEEISRLVLKAPAFSIYGSPITLIDGDVIIDDSYVDVTTGTRFSFCSPGVRGYNGKFLLINGYEYPKAYIGSRALLDTPVTKTDKQVMKITYEFVLPNYLQ